MPVDARRTISDLEELRALTADERGAQRIAWTPTWLKARAWFQSKLAALPVEHHLDAAGNSWTTLRGESDRTLILGSHLDSVPNGGWLDGCLGVLASFEVLRGLAEDFHGKPPITIRLVDWADEEGARFGRSLFGSSAFAGTHSIRGRPGTDGSGRHPPGGCPAGMPESMSNGSERPRWNADRLAAYLELHIEQGPVLERKQLPLGVVLGTKGVERHAITFHGQEAHSGSTPMAVRRDALAAAAKLALEIRPIAEETSRRGGYHGQREDVSGHRYRGGGTVRNHAGHARSGRGRARAACWPRPRKQAGVSPRRRAARWSGPGSGVSNRYRLTRG